MKKIISVFLVAGIGGIAALGLDRLFSKHDQIGINRQVPDKSVKFVSLPGSPAETTLNFVNAAEMTVHAVVHIKISYASENQYQDYANDPFYNLFFGARPQQQQPSEPMSAGSGVIVSGDGYIVTNNHVVDHAEKIEVVLNDKRSYIATVIGRDPNTDLALLKINEQNLPYVTYGNSDDLKVGEWVLAVGNPFNLTSTVTAGIVSAKGRNLDIMDGRDQGAYRIESYIQTDAAINPGNSGGALVNTSGQLVGINAAIKSNTGSYAGYSFAVPVNIVKKVTADLLEYGEVQRAFIGVGIRDLDARLASEKHIKDIRGVYVNAITDGGAGEEAGIKEGDIILKIADVDVNDVPQLHEQISKFRPGDKVMITLSRQGTGEMTIPLTLKNLKGNTAVVKKEKSEVINILGASFEQLSPDEMKRLNIKNGLKITRLNGGKLRASGINEGFVITRIDKKDVGTLDDLKNALGNKEGGVLIEGIYPNGLRAYYGFGL